MYSKRNSIYNIYHFNVKRVTSQDTNTNNYTRSLDNRQSTSKFVLQVRVTKYHSNNIVNFISWRQTIFNIV